MVDLASSLFVDTLEVFTEKSENVFAKILNVAFSGTLVNPGRGDRKA